MAKKTILVDDLDGGLENVLTHTFAIDDDRYEIDLSSQNLMRLRSSLEPFVSVARSRKTRDRSRSRPITPPVSNGGLNREERQAVRTWAKDNGYDVGDRGAFSKEVLEAFREAHPVSSG